MRAAASPNLSTRSIALGPLRLGATWAAVDIEDAATRATLLAYVGTHIVLHPDDTAALAPAGLALTDGRLVEAAPAAEMATVEGDTPPAPPAAKRRR